MTLRDDLLPRIEALRGIPGALGFRPYTSVVLRTRTWSGAEAGEGTATDVNLPLTAGGYPAKVRQITAREVATSAGRYTDADFVVGPLTPAFDGGGYTAAQLAPGTSNARVERHVVLTGPGEDASEWLIVGDQKDRALRYTLTIRRTQRTR